MFEIISVITVVVFLMLCTYIGIAQFLGEKVEPLGGAFILVCVVIIIAATLKISNTEAQQTCQDAVSIERCGD